MRNLLAFLRLPALLASLLAALPAGYSAAATTTLGPVADAYVQDGTWANTNAGTSVNLFAKTSGGQNYDSYLKFDMTSVNSIASAKLRIAASVSSSVGMTVYPVANITWAETAITWNNKPPRGGALGSVTVSGNTYTYYEFEVGSYLIAEKTAGRNIVSFALHIPQSSNHLVWMKARESASGNPPELVITLNDAPTVALTSPANGATFTAPASIALTATAADTDGTIQNVEFFHDGTNLIATVTSAPYTFNWTNVAAGSYSLTAKATDNVGASTTSVPVSVTVNTGVAQINFIHTDHLSTPRLITNGTGQVVWRWDQTEPFGNNVPNENPSGLGTFTCNLRLPGQYFDKETNLHYNYFRDYDPGIGRYIQSDPIGLNGGVNTYGYVGGNPISRTDPTGQFFFLPIIAAALSGGSATTGAAVVGGAALVGTAIAIQASRPPSGSGSNSADDSFPIPSSKASPVTSSSAAGTCPPEKCDEQREKDEQMCRMTTLPGTGARARCWASVTDRWAACRKGNPLPPLVMW